MAPECGVYLFALGLASGTALLAITAYRRVSPRWLAWLLAGSGWLVISRYVTMALFTHPHAPQRFAALRHCWFATSVGLTLPSVMAIDQLLRHPAMSPQRLLRWFSPLLVAYGTIIVFGPTTIVVDADTGWRVQLHGGWQTLLGLIQGVFVLGFVVVSAMLIRKVAVSPIRTALLGLALGHTARGLAGWLVATGQWPFQSVLYSEMFILLALWFAYDTSWTLQQNR